MKESDLKPRVERVAQVAQDYISLANMKEHNINALYVCYKHIVFLAICQDY